MKLAVLVQGRFSKPARKAISVEQITYLALILPMAFTRVILRMRLHQRLHSGLLLVSTSLRLCPVALQIP